MDTGASTSGGNEGFVVPPTPGERDSGKEVRRKRRDDPTDAEEFEDYLGRWDKYADKRQREPSISEGSDFSVELNEEEVLVHGGESRKRGRPITTGEWEKKKVKLAARQREKEERRLKELTDPSVPATLSKNRREREYKLAEELRHAPTEDLARLIIENVATVDKVNQSCRNLKGTDQSSLNKASSTISAAATHLINRVKTGDEGTAKEVEIEDLRKRNAELEEQMRRLRREMEESHGTPWEGGVVAMEVDAPPQARESSPPIGSGRKRRANVIREDPQDAEDVEENRREEILDEIQRKGMPAAIRPPLQGKPGKVIDPEVFPEAEPKDGGLEGRIMREIEKIRREFESLVRGLMAKLAMPAPTRAPPARRNPGGATSLSNLATARSRGALHPVPRTQKRDQAIAYATIHGASALRVLLFRRYPG